MLSLKCPLAQNDHLDRTMLREILLKVTRVYVKPDCDSLLCLSPKVNVNSYNSGYLSASY